MQAAAQEEGLGGVVSGASPSSSLSSDSSLDTTEEAPAATAVTFFFLALLKPMPRCRFPPIGDEEYLKARATNVREPDSAQHHEAVLSIVRVAGTCYATTLTTAGPKVSVRAGSAILQTPF